MPRVLNYKSTHGIPEGAVYIGRAMPRYRLQKSKWANPYPLRRNATREERAEVIAKYELYLYASGLINDVHELHGTDLVCWCEPEACHGHLLLRLANAEEHHDDATAQARASATRGVKSFFS